LRHILLGSLFILVIVLVPFLPFVMAQGSDFSIDLLTPAKNSYEIGEAPRLWARVLNIGSVPIDPYDLQGQFSVLSPSGIEVPAGAGWNGNSIPTGGVVIIENTDNPWIIPNNAESGSYALRVTINSRSRGVSHSAQLGNAFSISAVPPPDFRLSISPQSQVVTEGQSITFTVTVESLNGWTTPVSLSVSGLPYDATSSFDPNPVVPTSTSTLYVSTSTSTGQFSLVVVGEGEGRQHTTPATLIIEPSQAAEFDFSISTSPSSATVQAGQAADVCAVTVSLASGNPGRVDFSLSGLPSNVGTYAFSPPYGDPTFTSVLSIGTYSGASPETYYLTIVGIGGGKTRSTPFTLTVTGQVQPPATTARLRLPDLVVVTIAADPSSPRSGDVVHFTVSVQNQGGDFASPSKTELYLDGGFFGAGDVGGLSAGQTHAVAFQRTWTAREGQHSICARADAQNSVAESNEDNNDYCASLPVGEVSAPKLKVEFSNVLASQSANFGDLAYLITTKLTPMDIVVFVTSSDPGIKDIRINYGGSDIILEEIGKDRYDNPRRWRIELKSPIIKDFLQDILLEIVVVNLCIASGFLPPPVDAAGLQACAAYLDTQDIFDKADKVAKLFQTTAILAPIITLDSITIFKEDGSSANIPSSALDASTLRFPNFQDTLNEIAAKQKSSQIVAVKSPVHLLVIDSSSGMRVGEDANGQVVNEIPGAFFLGPENAHLAYLPPDLNNYRIEVTGTSSGQYRLIVTYASGSLNTRDASGSITTGQTLVYSVASSTQSINLSPASGQGGWPQQDITLTLTSAAITAAIVLVSSEILLRRRGPSSHRRRR